MGYWVDRALRMAANQESVSPESGAKTDKTPASQSFSTFGTSTRTRRVPKSTQPKPVPAFVCDAFASPVGVATCSVCGYGLGFHFWRLGDCERFKIGAPDGRCGRCGAPEFEHLDAGTEGAR